MKRSASCTGVLNGSLGQVRALREFRANAVSTATVDAAVAAFTAAVASVSDSELDSLSDALTTRNRW